MKLLKFNILIGGNADSEHEENSGVVSPYRMPYNTEADMEWAKKQSVDGEISIEELADYIIAQKDIVEGEYVTIDGVLYLATMNIPNGEPVIVGQNAIATTVEQQLYELKGE